MVIFLLFVRAPDQVRGKQQQAKTRAPGFSGLRRPGQGGEMTGFSRRSIYLA